MSTALAASLSERDLQKQVRAMLLQFGWKTAVTWNSIHSPKGWPDLFAVREHGAIISQPDWCETAKILANTRAVEAVAIELKSEKGKVSDEQERWLELLARLPGVKFAGIVRPSDWYAGVLDEVLR